MPWQTKVHPGAALIETIYAGILTPSELREAVHKTLDLAREHRALKFLADCSTLEGGHSVVDLYELAHNLSPKDLPVHSLREAVVLPSAPQALGNVKFWEDVCANRGAMVQPFRDRESALAWLNTQ